MGIDDTDSAESRGTGRLARNIAAVLSESYGIFGVTRHQLFVHPEIPFTSHNSSAVIHVIADQSSVETVFQTTKKLMLEDYVESSDPGLAASSAEQVTPAVVAFGQDAKAVIVTRERALQVARNSGIRVEGLGGTNGGIIGAVAGIGLASSKNDGRFLLKDRSRDLAGTRSVSEILQYGIDQIMTLQGDVIVEGDVKILRNVTPSFINGKAVLFVEKTNDCLTSLKRP